MAFNTALLVDYSWTDIAKAAKTAMMSAALGGTTLSVGGRQIGRISIEDAKQLYVLAQQQITLESNPNDGGIVLAELL